MANEETAPPRSPSQSGVDLGHGSGPDISGLASWSILNPDTGAKLSKHLLTCLPDSRAFRGSMLSWGKNLTHRHSPCGPSELCGLSSLHSRAFPAIPAPHQGPLHSVAQRNGNLKWITVPSIKFFSYGWVSQPQNYWCLGARAFFIMGFVLRIVCC